MSLSKTEEHLLNHLWKLGKGFMKDIIQAYDNPKPAPTTIATLLKRMRDKGFIDYNVQGKSREYYPLVKKEDYLSGSFHGFVKKFFGDSTEQFASFFTKSTDLTTEQLKELRKIIDEEIKRKEQ